MNSPRQRYIIDTFLKAINNRASDESRLRAGLLLRLQFQESLRAGVIPEHPRFLWLRKQARALLEHLIEVAKDYNKNAKSDKASMADLLDICQMTSGHIKAICDQGLLDPDEVKLLPFEEVKPELIPIPTEDDKEES